MEVLIGYQHLQRIRYLVFAPGTSRCLGDLLEYLRCEDIYTGIKEVERLQGGLVVVAGGRVLARLPLPIGGLLSDRPLEDVVAQLEKLEALAVELGSRLPSPFATLSFLALPVIPELRLTDLGLIDVSEFKLIK